MGLLTSGYAAQGANQAREELAHSRAMLKGAYCTLPVDKMELPPVEVGPWAEEHSRHATVVEGSQNASLIRATRLASGEGLSIPQKNKNPLNVKALGGNRKWAGQVGVDKFGHAIFEREEYGVRAGALVLRSYARRHNICTVRALVERFAEGNHEGYEAHLCRKLQVGPTDPVDLIKLMPQVLRAMVRFESGKELPDHFFAPYDVVAKL